MSARVEAYRDIVTREVAGQGNVIPVSLALATIDAESGGVPGAYRAEVAINDGSIGLMQILLGTARGNGYSGTKGDKTTLTGLFAPATNIRYGVKHLTGLWNRLGSAADVASAYNGGVRPNLGFGSPYVGAEPLRLCLARDGKGKCIQWREVAYGEYGNQPYVDKVLRLMQSYSGAYELPPVVIDGSDDDGGAGGGSPGGATSALAIGGLLVLGALAVKRILG